MFIDFNACEGDSILERTKTIIKQILGSVKDKHFDIVTTPEGSALFTVLDVTPSGKTNYIPAIYNQIGNISCRSQFHHNEHWHYIYTNKMLFLKNPKNIIPFIVLGESNVIHIEVANVMPNPIDQPDLGD